MVAKLQIASPAPTDRERIWVAIRELGKSGGTFTSLDVARLSGVDRSKGKIKAYLAGLDRAGFIRAIMRQRGAYSVYELVNDCGVDAPRINTRGRILPPSGRNRMWKAMRILGTFTTRELVYAASIPDAPVAEQEADYYCKYLCRGGYLRGGKGRWAFIPAMNTGPKAPQILRVQKLYDPNKDAVMYESAPQGRDDL